MPRRLLPRPAREVGKRGQILLVFGLVWIGLGASLALYVMPAYRCGAFLWGWLGIGPRGRHRRFPPVRTGGCPAVMRQDI